MIVSRISPLTQKVVEIDLPITEEQVILWNSGQGLIQDIFPDLTPSQREFILTGICEEEWNQLFGDEDEEDE